MVAQPLRAVYEKGRLRLLDPVDLVEGQEIQLMILSDEERILAALSDLVVKPSDHPDEDIDEEALTREIQEAFRGQPPLSDTIIAERQEGP